MEQKEKIYTNQEKIFLDKAIRVLALNMVGEEKTKEILKNIKTGGDGVMLAVIDMLNEEKRQRKIELEKRWNEGRKEGRTEGRMQAKMDYIKNMLKEKLPIDLISRITGMSSKEIEKLR